MTKHNATKWLRRFYTALNKENVKVHIKKDMVDPRVPGEDRYTSYRVVFGISGLVTAFNDANGNIYLNPSRQRYGGVVKALIHELIHEVAQEKTELQVLKLEKGIYEALSDRQLYNLLKKAFV